MSLPQQQMMNYPPPPEILSQPPPQYLYSVEVQSVQKSQMLCSIKWIKAIALIADLVFFGANIFFVINMRNTDLTGPTVVSIFAEVTLLLAVIGDISLCCFDIPPKDNNKSGLCFWLVAQIICILIHLLQLIIAEVVLKFGVHLLSNNPGYFVGFPIFGFCWLPFRFWSIYSVASYNEYLIANPLIPIVPEQEFGQIYDMNAPPPPGMMMNNPGSQVYPSAYPPEASTGQNSPV